MRLTCGRCATFLPVEVAARLFHTVNPLPNVAPSWHVAPTNDAMAVRRAHRDIQNGGDKRHLHDFRGTANSAGECVDPASQKLSEHSVCCLAARLRADLVQKNDWREIHDAQDTDDRE